RRQVLDDGVFELALEQARHFASGRERDERYRVVADGIGFDEAAPHAFDQLAIVPFGGKARRDHGTDARAADGIDFDTGFANRAQYPYVRKAACPSSRQHDTERMARYRASEPRNVSRSAHVMMRQGGFEIEPARGGAASDAAFVQEHHLHALRDHRA